MKDQKSISFDKISKVNVVFEVKSHVVIPRYEKIK